MTFLAGHLDIWQEVHLDGLIAIASTGLAAPSFHVERESAWLIASDLCFWQIDEKRSDVGKDTRIGGGIGTWRTSDRALVNIHHLIYIFQSLDAVVGHGCFQRTVEMMRENGLQGLVDESGFATSADTCNDNEFAKWKFGINMLQVVACASMKDERLAIALSALRRDSYLLLSVQVLGCDGISLKHLFGCALEYHLALP